MNKKKIAEKMPKEIVKKQIAEHKRIIPELKKAGLKKEMKAQIKDLKELKNA